jgi:hypothetical protein
MGIPGTPQAIVNYLKNKRGLSIDEIATLSKLSTRTLYRAQQGKHLSGKTQLKLIACFIMYKLRLTNTSPVASKKNCRSWPVRYHSCAYLWV